MESIINKIKSYDTPILKEVIRKELRDIQIADRLFDLCLTELETRLPKDEFIKFCEEL